MASLKDHSAQFRFQLERFINACDAYEDEKKWSREKKGEMEAFYQNDILSFILRLIAVDGVRQEEASYLNETFGFDYTAEELEEVYRLSKDEIGDDFDEQLLIGARELKKLDESLYELYRDLFRLICDIIIDSDGRVSEEEKAQIEKLKALLV